MSLHQNHGYISGGIMNYIFFIWWQRWLSGGPRLCGVLWFDNVLIEFLINVLLNQWVLKSLVRTDGVSNNFVCFLAWADLASSAYWSNCFDECLGYKYILVSCSHWPGTRMFIHFVLSFSGRSDYCNTTVQFLQMWKKQLNNQLTLTLPSWSCWLLEDTTFVILLAMYVCSDT